MNFQAARNDPGNFVQMQGTAVKFDIKTGQYGSYALGNMVDNTGLNEKVFYAASDESPLPDVSIKNKLAVWGVRFDANTQKFKVYFNGLVSNQPQNASQQPQQAPQQAAQATNSPSGGGYLLEITERIARALETIAANGQSFEQKYNLNEGHDAHSEKNQGQDDDIPY